MNFICVREKKQQTTKILELVKCVIINKGLCCAYLTLCLNVFVILYVRTCKDFQYFRVGRSFIKMFWLNPNFYISNFLPAQYKFCVMFSQGPFRSVRRKASCCRTEELRSGQCWAVCPCLFLLGSVAVTKARLDLVGFFSLGFFNVIFHWFFYWVLCQGFCVHFSLIFLVSYFSVHQLF